MFCVTCGTQKTEDGKCPSCDANAAVAQSATEEPVYFGDDGSGKVRKSKKKLILITAAILIPVLAGGGYFVYDYNNKAQAKSYAQQGCQKLQSDWSSDSADAATKKFKLATAIDSKYRDFTNGVRKWQTADLDMLNAELAILDIKLKVIAGDYWYLSASDIYLQYTLPQMLKQDSAQVDMDNEKAKLVKACAAL